jgi:hypothetical protein
MAIPQPLTSPDFGVRAASVNDLEITLVKFLQQLFADSYRLDNPTLNLAQSAAPLPEPRIYAPDEPPVSFDPEARAQTLYLKVPPRIERGRVPRTVTGEIAVDKLPDCPAIIVQTISARVLLADSHTSKVVTVRIMVSAYDENPDSGGYQDVLNMIETMEIALTSYGLGAMDQRYPIQLPIEWKVIEPDTFPHFVGEMITNWVLPAARPMPDLLESIIPGEHIEMGLKFEEPPDNPSVAIP